ncbi:MAG: carboxypeptidase M32 [Bdellovibrionales bacterium]|nr:carboxypeptidase M32 [Bdellovibrionales bacterium]
MTPTPTGYSALEKLTQRIHHLQHLSAIVGWDEAVMMPEGGSESRAGAMAELNVMIHEAYNGPEIPEILARAKDDTADESDPWRRANVREFERVWKTQTCLPADFVEKVTLACMRSEQAWRELRSKNDWKGFKPLFSEVLKLKREEAAIRAQVTGLSRYDSMLEIYDPGMRTESLQRTFADLESFLPEFIPAVVEQQRADRVERPRGPFPAERQRALGTELMKAVGFDFKHGRLDVSHHPFCGGVPRDVRITTRYREDDFTQGLMGVLHETGHAKYEQGLPQPWLAHPVGASRGMAFHESQSLFMEMQVARSREFLEFAAPAIRRHMAPSAGDSDPAYEAENLRRLFTRVNPSYIRVEADEVTYPCHVILRFNLERALIGGDLSLDDLPGEWDARMKSGLGLSTLGNDKDGCMQDVHWPAGLFGYFPSYTLGAIIAAQLMAALEKDHPSLRSEVAAGDFAGMNAWLRKAVWSQGSFFTTDELLRKATGAPLGTEPFKNHLRRRYLDG